MSRPLISIIAPVYNEEATLDEFTQRIRTTLAPLAQEYDYEIILVDDGSTDRSLEVMKRLAGGEERLLVIELRRNYGQTAALQAGLDVSKGDILVTLDADLQHFPEEIPAFLAKIKEGYDVVCGWRRQRTETILRRWPSRMANWMIRRIARLEIHDFGTTFRAYRAEMIKELRLFGEFHRYVPALTKDLGARIAEIPIQNITRPAGQSKYGIKRTMGVFLDLLVLFFFIRYMDRPMRAFGKLGLLAFAAGAGILAYLVIHSYVTGISAVRERQGWFLMSIMLLIASVQIFLTGILAEFLMRTHYAYGDRRVYKVRSEYRKPAKA